MRIGLEARTFRFAFSLCFLWVTWERLLTSLRFNFLNPYVEMMMMLLMMEIILVKRRMLFFTLQLCCEGKSLWMWLSNNFHFSSQFPLHYFILGILLLTSWIWNQVLALCTQGLYGTPPRTVYLWDRPLIPLLFSSILLICLTRGFSILELLMSWTR